MRQQSNNLKLNEYNTLIERTIMFLINLAKYSAFFNDQLADIIMYVSQIIFYI